MALNRESGGMRLEGLYHETVSPHQKGSLTLVNPPTGSPLDRLQLERLTGKSYRTAQYVFNSPHSSFHHGKYTDH